jgi:hypothetical protein
LIRRYAVDAIFSMTLIAAGCLACVERSLFFSSCVPSALLNRSMICAGAAARSASIFRYSPRVVVFFSAEVFLKIRYSRMIGRAGKR